MFSMSDATVRRAGGRTGLFSAFDRFPGRPVLVSALFLALSLPPATGAPVAYWSFDDDFSATVGGALYDGTPVNGASIDGSNSRFGAGAARFERDAGQSVHIPASPFDGGSHTYAAWYHLDVDTIGGSNRYFVLEASDGDTWPASYGLRIFGGEQAGQVFTHDDGTVPSGTPNTTFPSGPHREWRHIAVTYDAETLRLKAYLDGEAIAVLPLRSGATALSPSTYLNIGAHRDGTGRNWEGWIDEVAVWNRVLEHREIELLQFLPPDRIGDFRNAGFAAWIRGFDLLPERRHPEADASGDGITNLEKYAFGLDPTLPGRKRTPRITGAGTDRTGSYVTLAIPKNPDGASVELGVETSRDLSEWSTAEGTVVEETPEMLVIRIDLPE